MAINCRLILSLPEFQGVFTVLAGEKGLNNAIRWTHFLESEKEAEFLQGNELVFTTGIAFQDDPHKLAALVSALSKHHAAGLVINIGKYFEHISDEVINCAEKSGIPLMTVPWKYKLVDITRTIGRMIIEDDFHFTAASHLLENILFSIDGNFAEYRSTAEFNGYYINQPMCIAIFNFPNLKQYLLNYHVAITKEEFQFIIHEIVNNIMRNSDKQCLYLWRKYNMVMTIPVDKINEIVQTKSIFEKIKSAICSRMPTLVTHIGLGNGYASLEQLRTSYREANFAIRLCQNNPHSGYVLYRTAGIYKLFNKIHAPKILKEFYHEILDTLLQYDKDNHTEFTKTLEIYFQEGENTVSASNALYIHRNTLKYRLHRIEEILGYPVSNSKEKSNLQVAFQIKKYLEIFNESE
ncbi:MAG: PucR family transcriptional regulator ligand-binding domain-containing protein [Oscillospiraceae bacterium]|nr:PucR family transcriptional regulator ligand-binding domain-containing protein [Oscillospiraceae bacterium]